ncbi:phosphoethanolamine/phosphocholine phosphatase-like [Scleropages formosus]|nr:probable phosphatase phospho1 [Scleropages formosus]KPP60276.1 phosphoethanolamine/phosphocholine phosphatase-like [Scleropages formosus]
MAATVHKDKRFLIFFDFDETIVDESSDDAVVQAAPGKRLPDWLRDSFRPGRYNEQMQRVMAYMAEQGVAEEAIRSAVEAMPASPGILDLFQFLRAHPRDFEVVLVSDANAYFIEAWLRRVGARQLFLNVFTNPASFDSSGRLLLLPYHSHDCPRCPENMCKRAIVQGYLAQRTRERGRPFQSVCYVGDGANDLCPSLVLGPGDMAFARRDYPLHRLLTEVQAGQPSGIKATVVPWVTGADVVVYLKDLLEQR